MKYSGGKNAKELSRKIINGFSYAMASLFIVIGTGILSGLLFPEPFPITFKKRLIFGGLVLLYGLGRLTALLIKRKKEKVSIETVKEE